MTNNNYPIDIPKTYTVSYFDEAEWNKDLTQNDLKQQEIISASYYDENQAEERGYGPCRNSLCGCGCSSVDCNCKRFDASLSDSGFGSFSATGRVGNREASGEVSASLFREYKDSNGEFRILSASAGGNSGDGLRAGVDLIGFKTEGIEARTGLNVDTGISGDSDGNKEFKLLGFGVSTGKKKGISLPIGEIKVDTDNCVIQ